MRPHLAFVGGGAPSSEHLLVVAAVGGGHRVPRLFSRQMSSRATLFSPLAAGPGGTRRRGMVTDVRAWDGRMACRSPSPDPFLSRFGDSSAVGVGGRPR